MPREGELSNPYPLAPNQSSCGEEGGEAVIDFDAASAGRHHIRLMHRGGGRNTWGVKVEAREAASSGPRKPVID